MQTKVVPYYRTQFRPTLEEVRSKYYREMKKFICIPEKFGGLADSGTADNQPLDAYLCR